MSFKQEPREPGRQIAIRQDQAQPVTRVRLATGVVRYTYDLALDSKVSREPGQDFLVFRYAAGRLAFAVCDGVGGSFLGNLAAQFLGQHLTDWLWRTAALGSAEDLKRELSRFLHDLVPPAREGIARYPLPHHLPSLVREVLEEKRAYGSEAMFVCGRIEWPQAQDPGLIALAVLGDAELQVLNIPDGATLLTGTTQERWSTHRGPRGQVKTSIRPARDIQRVIAYSDGLHSLATQLHRLPDNILDQEVARLQDGPNGDDISLIDIALEERDMAPERSASVPVSPARPHLPSPSPAPHSIPAPELRTTALAPPKFLSPDNDAAVRPGTRLRWTAVPGAESYHVQQATTAHFDPSEVLDEDVSDPWLTVEDDKPGHYCYRVRALASNSQSEWSSPLRIFIESQGRKPNAVP